MILFFGRLIAATREKILVYVLRKKMSVETFNMAEWEGSIGCMKIFFDDDDDDMVGTFFFMEESSWIELLASCFTAVCT